MNDKMICIAKIAYDRSHLKFIHELQYAFNYLLPTNWEGIIDTGGSASQESWFHLLANREHEKFAEDLVEFVSKHKDTDIGKLDEFKSTWAIQEGEKRTG